LWVNLDVSDQGHVSTHFRIPPKADINDSVWPLGGVLGSGGGAAPFHQYERTHMLTSARIE
jgi:hypothetical protein